MRVALSLLTSLSTLLLSACGSSEAECRPDVYTCMKTLVAEVQPCAHPSSTPGKSDLSSPVCNYADGTTIALSSASGPIDGPWTATIRKDGAVCLTINADLEGDDRSVEIITTKGTYREVERRTATSIEVTSTCPDGKTFTSAELAGCTVESHRIGFAYERYNAQFKLALGAEGQEVEVFDCAP